MSFPMVALVRALVVATDKLSLQESPRATDLTSVASRITMLNQRLFRHLDATRTVHHTGAGGFRHSTSTKQFDAQRERFEQRRFSNAGGVQVSPALLWKSIDCSKTCPESAPRTTQKSRKSPSAHAVKRCSRAERAGEGISVPDSEKRR